jgi:hypothetical protein
MLHCPKCNTDKPESEFFKNKSRKTGYNSYCKVCLNYSTERLKEKYAASFIPLSELTCSKCGETQQIEGNFFRHPKEKNGYFPVCFTCQKKTYKSASKVSAQWKKNYVKVLKPRIEANTQKVFDLLGNHCVDCNREATVDTFCAFDLHHKQPEQKKFNVGNNKLKLLWNDEIQEEVLKCDLLCACCHRLRHKANLL